MNHKNKKKMKGHEPDIWQIKLGLCNKPKLIVS